MGLFQAYIIPDIKEQDWDRVGQAEHMSIEVFPTLNERLYLCFLYGKNINPEQDISLGKPLPEEYETYIDNTSINSTLVRCYCFSRIILCFERKIKIEKRKQHGFTKF